MRPVPCRLAAALLLGAGAASAAEICYGPSFPLADLGHVPDDGTVFACPLAGNRTVPDLAGAGLRIVKLTPVTVSGDSQAWQLVVQRADRIFRNGFD